MKKSRNFPYRKLRRRLRAQGRLTHQFPSKDIRFRHGKLEWIQIVREIAK